MRVQLPTTEHKILYLIQFMVSHASHLSNFILKTKPCGGFDKNSFTKRTCQSESTNLREEGLEKKIHYTTLQICSLHILVTFQFSKFVLLPWKFVKIVYSRSTTTFSLLLMLTVSIFSHVDVYLVN